jgi:hypothetical protein
MRLGIICRSQQSSDWVPKSAIRYPRSSMLKLPCPVPPVAKRPRPSLTTRDFCSAAPWPPSPAAGGAFPQGHWVLSPRLCGARQLCPRRPTSSCAMNRYQQLCHGDFGFPALSALTPCDGEGVSALSVVGSGGVQRWRLGSSVKRRLGVFTGGYFVGATGYAPDTSAANLLPPTSRHQTNLMKIYDIDIC